MFTPHWPRIALLFCMLLPVAVGLDAQEPDNRAEERASRLSFLADLAAQFEISTNADQPKSLAIRTEPLIRYSNPVRNFFSDGALYVWNADKQPAVIGAVSVRGTGAVWCELTSLSGATLTCRNEGEVFWTPTPDEQVGVTFAVDTPVPNDSRRRTLVIRQLARRFSVSMFESAGSDQKKTLRLLTSPLVSWQDEEGGSQGACFAFAESTDPEALIVIEARPGEEGRPASWSYTIARMTSRPLQVNLNGDQIADIKGYWKNPKTIRDRYLERQVGTYPSE